MTTTDYEPTRGGDAAYPGRFSADTQSRHEIPELRKEAADPTAGQAASIASIREHVFTKPDQIEARDGRLLVDFYGRDYYDRVDYVTRVVLDEDGAVEAVQLSVQEEPAESPTIADWLDVTGEERDRDIRDAVLRRAEPEPEGSSAAEWQAHVELMQHRGRTPEYVDAGIVGAFMAQNESLRGQTITEMWWTAERSHVGSFESKADFSKAVVAAVGKDVLNGLSAFVDWEAYGSQLLEENYYTSAGHYFRISI